MSYPEHEPYHERRIDQQILDTLLRMEELLRGLQGTGYIPPERGNYEDRVTPETKVAPAPKGKRK